MQLAENQAFGNLQEFQPWLRTDVLPVRNPNPASVEEGKGKVDVKLKVGGDVDYRYIECRYTTDNEVWCDNVLPKQCSLTSPGDGVQQGSMRRMVTPFEFMQRRNQPCRIPVGEFILDKSIQPKVLVVMRNGRNNSTIPIR